MTEATAKYNVFIDEHSLSAEATSRGAGALSTYKLGDEISERPWSTKEYFSDGVDKLRMLMYHEFGHHVHQSYKLTGRYARGENSIEKRLGYFWRETKKPELEQFAPSSYAMANQYEYFVESFAMYMFGRTDMMHPKMMELIEDILNERGK